MTTLYARVDNVIIDVRILAKKRSIGNIDEVHM
jgi:hypothetical protein